MRNCNLTSPPRLNCVVTASTSCRGSTLSRPFEQEHRVVKLNGQLLLEVRAENGDGERNGDIRQVRIKVSPIHWIFKVELTNKELRLGYLDDEYLSKLIKDKMLDIDCVQEGGFILTAVTSRLQQLVAHVAHDPDAFSWTEYEKVENQ